MGAKDVSRSSAAYGVESTLEGCTRIVREVDATDDTSGSQMALPLSKGNHVMRAEEAVENNAGGPPVEADAGFGKRLCMARERQGLSRADVAARLKLPVKLIARLERDDYEGLTQGVFLRGYLSSYARLVGVPVVQATHAADVHSQAPPLVATGTISRSRYLFDRYSVSATYLVLTAIIVVPAVWLATHGGLEQSLVTTTPLDPPAAVNASRISAPLPTPDTAPGSQAVQHLSGTAGADSEVASTPAVPVDQSPIVASMAPFPSAVNAAPQPDGVAAAAEAGGSGMHVLALKLDQQSWVEITSADGRKLEYAMLPAGSEREYRSDGALTVRLGNAQGAQVRTDGRALDLTPYQRGNVAHMKVFADEGADATRINQ